MVQTMSLWFMSSDFTPESGALLRVIWKNGETQTYSFTFEAE